MSTIIGETGVESYFLVSLEESSPKVLRSLEILIEIKLNKIFQTFIVSGLIRLTFILPLTGLTFLILYCFFLFLSVYPFLSSFFLYFLFCFPNSCLSTFYFLFYLFPSFCFRFNRVTFLYSV